jgi:hypothetical protein
MVAADALMRGRELVGHLAWADEPRAEASRRCIGAAGRTPEPFETRRSDLRFRVAVEGEGQGRATYGASNDRLAAEMARYDGLDLFRSDRNVRLVRTLGVR